MARNTKDGEGAAPAKKPAAKRATSKAKKATSSTPAEAAVAVEPAVPAQSVEPVNVEEKIRVRAYHLYLERKGDYGTPEQDWYQAEAEIRTKIA